MARTVIIIIRYNLELYGEYIFPRISWDLTIADINITWAKQTLDMVCHSKFRSWLDIPANETLDMLLQAKSKFGLNIMDISAKHTYRHSIRSPLEC